MTSYPRKSHTARRACPLAGSMAALAGFFTLGLLLGSGLISCAAPSASGEGEGGGTARPPRFFDTLVIVPDGEVRHVVGIHFQPRAGVSLTDLGTFRAGDPLPDPRSALARVDSPDVRISTVSFLQIAQRITEATTDEPSPRLWGYAYEDGQLRMVFDQRATVGAVVVVAAFVVLAVAGLVVALVLLRRLRRERERRRALLMTHEQQVDARERERTRIAREIHDGPIQDLHALRMRASVEGTAGADAGAVVDAGLREISIELRAIAEGLRPPSLGRFGLAAALASHVARLRERRPDLHVATRLDEDAVAGGDPDRPCLDERARISLFRVAQEALNNAVEHADARHIALSLTFEPDPRAPRAVLLEVRDDGKGLNGAASAELTELAEAGHFGLAGMYERAELLGGRLTVGPGATPAAGASAVEPAAVASGSGGGRGTLLRLVVPWSHASPAAPVAPRWRR